jgi:hypothetical protein
MNLTRPRMGGESEEVELLRLKKDDELDDMVAVYGRVESPD